MAQIAVPAGMIRFVARSGETVSLDGPRRDPRWHNDPYFRSLDVRSALCKPIVFRGEISGILYLENDLTHAAFQESHLEALEILARQTAISLEHGRLYREAQDEIGKRREVEAQLREHQDYLESEVDRRTQELRAAYSTISENVTYASNIQQSLLPPIENLRDAIGDVLVIWQPRDIVGGDLYWYRRYKDGYVIMLGDCTGHGVPGAFVTLLATGAWDRAVREHPDADPAALLRSINQSMKITLGQTEAEGPSDDGLDVGICRINTTVPSLTFAGAKLSLFCIRDGGFREIKGDKASIGYRKVPFDQVYTNHAVDLEPDTNFLMVTDGLIDQIGGERRRAFGKRRILEVMTANAHLPLEEQGRALMGTFESYQGSELRRDDVCLIGFKLS